MRKVSLLILSQIFILILLSCITYAKHYIVDSAKSAEVQTYNDRENEVYFKCNKECDDIYFLETIHFEMDNINIIYPQIQNLENPKKQIQINTLLKNAAFRELDEYDENDKRLTQSTNYTTGVVSRNLLSVCFHTYRLHSAAAYSVDSYYAINIDINNGSTVSVSDMFAVNKEFLNTLNNYEIEDDEYRNIVDTVFNYIYLDYSEEDVIQYLFDESEMDHQTISVFYKTDKFSFIIPTYHNLGNTVLIEFAYSDFERFMKKSKMWSELYAT